MTRISSLSPEYAFLTTQLVNWTSCFSLKSCLFQFTEANEMHHCSLIRETAIKEFSLFGRQEVIVPCTFAFSPNSVGLLIDDTSSNSQSGLFLGDLDGHLLAITGISDWREVRKELNLHGIQRSDQLTICSTQERCGRRCS